MWVPIERVIIVSVICICCIAELIGRSKDEKDYEIHYMHREWGILTFLNIFWIGILYGLINFAIESSKIGIPCLALYLGIIVYFWYTGRNDQTRKHWREHEKWYFKNMRENARKYEELKYGPSFGKLGSHEFTSWGK